MEVCRDSSDGPVGQHLSTVRLTCLLHFFLLQFSSSRRRISRVTNRKDSMMRYNSRSALWIGVLIFDLLAVGSGFAQTGKPPGRLTAAKAHVLGTTNFTKVASAATADATDRLDLPNDAAGEARRREMVDSFAADRATQLRTAAVLAAPVQIPNNVQGLPLAENESVVRGFAGISNFTQSAVNSGFSF